MAIDFRIDKLQRSWTCIFTTSNMMQRMSFARCAGQIGLGARRKSGKTPTSTAVAWKRKNHFLSFAETCLGSIPARWLPSLHALGQLLAHSYLWEHRSSSWRLLTPVRAAPIQPYPHHARRLVSSMDVRVVGHTSIVVPVLFEGCQTEKPELYQPTALPTCLSNNIPLSHKVLRYIAISCG